MTETSKDGFVPRHLRGVDVEGDIHLRTKCQFHAIAGNIKGWSEREYTNGEFAPRRCNHPVDPRSGLRLCAEHLDRLAVFNPRMYTLRNARKRLRWEESETVRRLRDDATRMRKVMAWQAKRLRGEPTSYEPERTPAPKHGTVYALLSGYNVKVGWTSRDLRDRLREYPPSTSVLVHYPAMRSEETRIKRKFAHLATHGNEWFSYDPQVREWVATMKAKHGEPDEDMECGPSATSVPRPHADKTHLRIKGYLPGAGEIATGKTA